MIKATTPYCLMPWIHFHVNNKGSVRACCVANIPYGNINKQSFQEIWQSIDVKKLRERFLKGERDNRCAACYKLEEAGGKSIRQETHEKFSQIDIQTIKNPIYFDIRFSNICNFRCRTCWHGASSGWFQDAKGLGRNIGEQAVLKNIEDFDQFIVQMGGSLLQAQEIYFAGGEPLIMQEHYQLLEWLIDKKATQLRLRYNTNFSNLNLGKKNILELWQYFPSIEILASIDATEQLGEYIRKGMNWQVILSNREKIRDFSNITFKIAPTLSVYNIQHLPELYSKAIELKMIDTDGLYLNILHRPLHFNVQILPSEKKEEILKVYQNFISENKHSESVKKQFSEVIDFMMAKDLSRHWKSFINENQTLDELRNENLTVF